LAESKWLKTKLRLDRQQILEYPQDLLPVENLAYEGCSLQDINRDNPTTFARKQKYLLVSGLHSVELPDGYEGEFLDRNQSFILAYTHGSNMTQSKFE